MKLGIIANSIKHEIATDVVKFIWKIIKRYDFDVYLNINTFDFLFKKLESKKLTDKIFRFDENKHNQSFDLLISFGGDGTMLYSASIALRTDSPLVGINFGKLGFLADIDYEELDTFFSDFLNNDYNIEERILIEGKFTNLNKKELLAVNDIVIDKGGWSRIIQIQTWINNNYLTTFSSDGLIISTPTGSTGYSLSTGGPILVPYSDQIVLSPICPHTLTLRPIVIPSDSEIKIIASSEYKYVSINADGHKVYKIKPPVEMLIKKSNKKLKLIRKKSSNYFETLRKKLMWGLDLRKI